MCALLWFYYDCTLAVDSALGGIEMLYLIGFGAMFTTFLVRMLNNLFDKRKRLTVGELLVIFVMVAVAIPWGILIRAALEAPVKLAIIHRTRPEPASWFTERWSPQSRDAIIAFARGGLGITEIPWREWIKPILYWSAMLLSFQCFAICLVLWFRRMFVEEERLPFPLATLGQSIIEHEPEAVKDPNANRFRTVVKVAFVLGLLACMPGILSVSADSHTPIPMNTSYYGTTTGIVRGLSVVLSWDPFVICFLLFFPIEVLFTVSVVHVGLKILVPTACLWFGVPTPDIGNFTFHAFGMGGMIGLGLWPLVFNWSVLKDMVLRALRGVPRRDNDPASMRTISVLMIVSFVSFVVLFVLGLGPGMKNPVHGFISVAFCMAVILWHLLSRMRMNAQQGWHFHAPWWIGGTVSRFHLNSLHVFKTPASFLSVSHVLHFASYHNTFAPHLHLFDALKIANQTNTRTRDIVKAAAIVLAIGLIVVIPGYLILIHHYGFDRSATTEEWHNFFSYEQPQHIIAYSKKTGVAYGWTSTIIGFFLIGWVMYMRREHIRFPFSAVGLVMCGVGGAYFGDYSTSRIWLPYVMVLVAKYAMYRWFGVRFFREKVIPTVMMIMMGMMTGMILFKLMFAMMGRGFLRPY